jgi:hypothetical protein
VDVLKHPLAAEKPPVDAQGGLRARRKTFRWLTLAASVCQSRS